MNTFQCIMLGLGATSIVGAPFLVARAIRRRQYHRLLEIPLTFSFLCYIVVRNVWPSAVQNAPPLVHRMLLVLFVLWIMEFLGFFRWLFNRNQKAQTI